MDWASQQARIAVRSATLSPAVRGLDPADREGMAAGAMLTVVAETMLPEAFLKGGSVVGMTTLLGFLAAISLKTME